MRPPKRGRKARATRKKQRGGSRNGKNTPKSKQPAPGPSQCHPSLKESYSHGCLPLETLRSAATKLDLDPKLEGKALRQALEEKLELKEPGERTFLNALPLSTNEKASLAKQYLRPAIPKAWISDPDMWLDSNNIADVLNQYEVAMTKNGKREFEFMGPFPNDFGVRDPYKGGDKCLMEEMCELRIENAMKNGTRFIGIVYNLDPHYKSGSHWVANFIDVNEHKCYFFDSYGMEPTKEIATFMKWLATQDPKMELQFNKRSLQKSNTECGMYCIYIIIRLLSGDSFVEITRRQPTDADMLDFRDWLFST